MKGLAEMVCNILLLLILAMLFSIGELLKARFLKEPTPSVGLSSLMVFDTGPYMSNGEIKQTRWINQLSKTIRVTKSYLWTGMEMGGNGDVHVELRRDSDGSILHILQWDHYADPVAPNHGAFLDYSPNYFEIDNGGTLSLVYFSVPIGQPAYAHHRAYIFFK